MSTMSVKTDTLEAADVCRNSSENAPTRTTSSRLRALAKRVLPLALQNLIRRFIAGQSGVREYARDYVRFIKNSGVLGQSEEGTLRARITAQYHVIEKGLSHYEPRLGFGEEMVCGLVAALRAYRDAGYPTSCSQYQSAIAVLECYRQFNGGGNAPIPREVVQFLNDLGQTGHAEFSGGYRVKRRGDLLASWRGDFASLAKNRHSIRHFSSARVDPEAIRRAIDLARWAPSACNRQPVRVHMLRKKEDIRAILELQGGAKGFIELIDSLLIVTVELRGYFGFAERNLCYVDGGLFAMSLMYALCYEGIGSCPLHLALNAAQDARLRRLANLEEAEATVVMLGAGNLPETLKVAYSQRKPLPDYLITH